MRPRSMQRHMIPLLLGVSAWIARPADAQLAKRISQAVRQKVSARSQELQDSMTKRATEPVDSALVRSNSVDSLASKASSKAGQAVSNAGRRTALSAEEKRVRDGIANGLELVSISFERNKSVIGGSTEELQALTKQMLESPNAILVQGRADPGMSRAAAQRLAEQRALALKAVLVAQGIQANRIFTAAGGVAQPGMAPLFVQRIR